MDLLRMFLLPFLHAVLHGLQEMLLIKSIIDLEEIRFRWKPLEAHVWKVGHELGLLDISWSQRNLMEKSYNLMMKLWWENEMLDLFKTNKLLDPNHDLNHIRPREIFILWNKVSSFAICVGEVLQAAILCHHRDCINRAPCLLMYRFHY
jgi:hypothetical protein